MSEIARLVLEFMVAGKQYTGKEVAAALGISERFAGMQLMRMAQRRHLDRHDHGLRRLTYSVPGTVTIVPPAPPSEGVMFAPSNLGQVIGRLMRAAE